MLSVYPFNTAAKASILPWQFLFEAQSKAEYGYFDARNCSPINTPALQFQRALAAATLVVIRSRRVLFAAFRLPAIER